MNRQITEQDEFLLSRLVDDDLPPEEARVLRARLESEPELRKVYARMTRLDGLLIARRVEQPNVDWQQFHQQVMAKVGAETPAGATVYKLSRYLKVVLPLAAAAAIAIIVMVQPRGSGVKPGSSPNSDIALLQSTETTGPKNPEASGLLVVRYDRGHVAAQESGIEVSYGRSDELQKEYQELDDHNRLQESYGAVVTVRDTSKPPVPKSVLVAAASLVF